MKMWIGADRVIFLLTVQYFLVNGFTTQDRINYNDQTVGIQAELIIQTCTDGASQSPVPNLSSFTFSYWARGCYERASTGQYQKLFNEILEVLQRCYTSNCGTRISVNMPQISCAGQLVYPDTVDLNYFCSTSWQEYYMSSTSTTTTTSAPTRRTKPPVVTIPGGGSVRSTVTSPEITTSSVDETNTHGTTDQSNGTESTTLADIDGMDKRVNKGNENEQLALILGIVIPLLLIALFVPIIICVVYRRRKESKGLLGGAYYDTYRDPSPVGTIPATINNGYDSDYGVYQDPDAFHASAPPPPPPTRGNHLSTKSTSDYNDPCMTDMTCTGPPGTPSPIRDAIYDASKNMPDIDEDDDPNAIYADPDQYRGVPDGEPYNPSDNLYDLPFTPRRPLPIPRANRDVQSESLNFPAYTHMVEGRPHNYATIRKSRPCTESQYYDLENAVQLYDSPVYDAVSDSN